jgi:hypothetical protein
VSDEVLTEDERQAVLTLVQVGYAEDDAVRMILEDR